MKSMTHTRKDKFHQLFEKFSFYAEVEVGIQFAVNKDGERGITTGALKLTRSIEKSQFKRGCWILDKPHILFRESEEKEKGQAECFLLLQMPPMKDQKNLS